MASVLWAAPEILNYCMARIENDIYSFGIILTELDTLLAPYSTIDTPIWQTLTQIQEGELTMQCLSFDPLKRPKCVDIIVALEQCAFKILEPSDKFAQILNR
ncbi:hypothetical protein THRCLA_22719 [Thraustotheca clavata]|uniref:Protein kinase domain-containing protein n=1 Tax=Thraustotheca clavata TaxID=74557 RepID=A0A1V9YU15_9STRA|nr:hypothetical protein THRCLA_22719 [Thraustotheca clavata]